MARVLGLICLLGSSTGLPPKTISKSAAVRFYDFVGPSLDLLAPFEDAPRLRALELGDVGKGPGLILEGSSITSIVNTTGNP